MIIGTRTSALAMAQTMAAKAALEGAAPDLVLEIKGISTRGDRQQHMSLAAAGSVGVFTREVEQALSSGQIDLAAHSAKDMPTALPEGLVIGAVLKREDPRDVWISAVDLDPKAAPAGTVAGTCSLRRQLQAKDLNPGLLFKDIRGNVETRLRKLADGGYDSLILAMAGLKRLGLLTEDCEDEGTFSLKGQTYYYKALPAELFMPAAGQGIIALECREGFRQELMEKIDHQDSALALEAERAFLTGIGGGCNMAAAVRALFETEESSRYLVVKGKLYADGQPKMAFARLPLSQDHADNMKLAGEAGLKVARGLV